MTGKKLTASIVRDKEANFVPCCDKCRTAGGGFGDGDYSFSYYCPEHHGADISNGTERPLVTEPWWYTAQMEMRAGAK